MADRHAIRPGTASDSRRAFDVFIESAVDLSVRIGAAWNPEPEETWGRLAPLYEWLAAHAAEWWVAEDGDGEPVGYARSIERGGLFELSEFFVRPGRQSAGVGRELLARAFPDDRGEVRAIIATTDVRAQRRYYGAGTAARFPIVALTGVPARDAYAEGEGDVEVARASDAHVGSLDEIEAAVLEFPRGDEFRWLLERREGYLYQRAGRPIGFAFVGATASGPIAALDPADQPPILRHVESRAAALEVKELSLEVPMINEVAVRHLLGRGFHMDQFLTLLMSSRPFGLFDRFIGFSPPFVL